MRVSTTMPSGGSIATMVEYCDNAQSQPFQRCEVRGQIGVDHHKALDQRLGFGSGMPTRRPSLVASRSAAAIHRFESLLAITTRGAKDRPA